MIQSFWRSRPMWPQLSCPTCAHQPNSAGSSMLTSASIRRRACRRCWVSSTGRLNGYSRFPEKSRQRSVMQGNCSICRAQELAAAIWRDIAKVAGIPADRHPPWQIVRSAGPHLPPHRSRDASRPASETSLINLFLAGDWTATGLPATLESKSARDIEPGPREFNCGPPHDARFCGDTACRLQMRRRSRCRRDARLLRLPAKTGHWVFELEADATIPAEYVLLRHYRGEPVDPVLEQKIANYLRRIQGGHDGWLYHLGEFDMSASVKADFALKISGRAGSRSYAPRTRGHLARGGAVHCNVFTRVLLSLFGVLNWRSIPEMPVEITLYRAGFLSPVEGVLLGTHGIGPVARRAGVAPARAEFAWRRYRRIVHRVAARSAPQRRRRINAGSGFYCFAASMRSCGRR